MELDYIYLEYLKNYDFQESEVRNIYGQELEICNICGHKFDDIFTGFFIGNDDLNIYTYCPDCILKDGVKVICDIAGWKNLEGTIAKVNEYYYICQNLIDGDPIIDKRGYLYSWFLDDDVKNLRILGIAMDNFCFEF